MWRQRCRRFLLNDPGDAVRALRDSRPATLSVSIPTAAAVSPYVSRMRSSRGMQMRIRS